MNRYQRACIIFSATLLAAAAVFVWQLRSGARINAEFAASEKALAALRVSSSRSRELRRLQADLDEQEARLFRRIPAETGHPLGLIREISSLAKSSGFRAFTIELVAQDASADVPAPAAAAGQDPAAGGKSGKTKKNAVGPRVVAMDIRCEAGFADLLLFLRRLYGLERIVSMEKLRIQRVDASLPRQSVEMRIHAYSF